MTTSLIGVYGATGYTGRRVAAELSRRGHALRLGARRDAGLRELASELGAEAVVARCDDPTSRNAFAKRLSVLVNCAGPFEDTAVPLASSAMAAGAHYIDTTGEPPVVESLVRRLNDTAKAYDRVIAPAVGFFGALPSLLASISAGDQRVEHITVAYWLEGWRMTSGSRAAAMELAGRRHVFRGGELRVERGQPSVSRWQFPDEIGELPVMEAYPAPEIVLMAHRLAKRSAKAVMSLATLGEIRADPGYHDVDDATRALTRFLVVTEACEGTCFVRTWASGTDIYGVTAPLVALAVERLIAGGVAPGVRAAHELGPARDLLRNLPGDRLNLPNAAIGGN